MTATVKPAGSFFSTNPAGRVPAGRNGVGFAVGSVLGPVVGPVAGSSVGSCSCEGERRGGGWLVLHGLVRRAVVLLHEEQPGGGPAADDERGREGGGPDEDPALARGCVRVRARVGHGGGRGEVDGVGVVPGRGCRSRRRTPARDRPRGCRGRRDAAGPPGSAAPAGAPGAPASGNAAPSGTGPPPGAPAVGAAPGASGPAGAGATPGKPVEAAGAAHAPDAPPGAKPGGYGGATGCAPTSFRSTGPSCAGGRRRCAGRRRRTRAAKRDDMRDVSVRSAGAPDVAGRQCGNGLVIAHEDGWETQYCHMAQGSLRVQQGQTVKAGEPLGKIGVSGESEFPHLHFTVRRDGKLVDPFALDAAPGSCGGGQSIWASAVRAMFHYHAGEVLNSGFASAPVTMTDIEEATAKAPARDAAMLIAFVRAIGLRKGDIQHLTLTSPSGEVLADSARSPLDNNKAQYMMFIGKKNRTALWPAGEYLARYTVTREDRVTIEKKFTLTF